MMVVHQGRHATVSVRLLLSGVATATSVQEQRVLDVLAALLDKNSRGGF
jgi:hypothetical protein